MAAPESLDEGEVDSAKSRPSIRTRKKLDGVRTYDT